jgi:hypothetical protein
LSQAGYAKNGSLVLALTGTTPVTVDLTDLSLGTTSAAGDFATLTKWFQISFNNLGPADCNIKQGASNPANLLGISTSPAQVVPAGSALVLQSQAGIAITGSAKTITITPVANTTLGIAVGGG